MHPTRVLVAHRQIVLIVNGKLGPAIPVAEISPALAEKLGVSPTTVRLGIDCARKMRIRHRLLSVHDPEIPDCARFGRVAVHGRDLVFIYFEEEVFGTGFKLVVKSVVGANELWVKTYHKITAYAAGRFFRKMDARDCARA